MDYLERQVVGLDGVFAQQENYRKSGFVTAYRNIRFEGVACNYVSANIPEVVELSKLPLDDILAYDSRLFPAPRSEFIKGWISPADGAALGYLSNSRLQGYGVIRACRNGYKIGPLFADRDETAGAVLKALVDRISPGTPFFLDVPEPNAAALELTRQYNMQVVFETARMYRGQPPLIDLNRVYGVSSFELG